MSDTRACVCGVPNTANYHSEVIIGRDIPGGTQTDYVDVYSCAEHVNEDNPVSMLHPDIVADGWDVIESTTTHLRGEE